MKQSSKSILKSKTSENKVQNPLLLQLPDSPQIAKIIAMKDNFRKNVEAPIQNIQGIEKNKTPQRCILHSNMLTLYCEIDRKPLCANCMYQQETHRKHKVVPLAKAMNYVKEDIASFEIKIEGQLNQCNAISKNLQTALIRNESFYPEIIGKLTDYYESAIKMLRDKQYQQINQVRQLKQKMKKQVLFLDQEVKRISSLLTSKLKSVSKQQSEDSIICRRNVFQILVRSNRIISYELNDVFPEDEGCKNIIDFNIFNDIFQMMKSKLIIMLPSPTIKTRNRLYSSGVVKSYSPNLKVHESEKSKRKYSPSVKLKTSAVKEKKGVTFIL